MPKSPDITSAFQHLLVELGAWIDASIDRNRQVPYHGIHDEGSFTFSWDAYYFLTGKRHVREFLSWLRDGFAAWARENMRHGYYKQGEVHHGTEPFTHFVARFRTLEPGNDVARSLLGDVAHHTGNWVAEIPAWYDWRERRFVSWSLGSEEVPTDSPQDYEEPDSIRPAMITLAAYAMTGENRYLDFCVDYADKWAEALMEKPLPKVIFLHGPREAYDPQLLATAEGTLTDRTELVVASGMVDYLLDLLILTGRPLYREALDQIMPTLVDVVDDPRSSVAAGLLSKFRRITGDTSHDEAITAKLSVGALPDLANLELLDLKDVQENRPNQGILRNRAIGHRYDQTRWGIRTNGTVSEITEPNPAAWVLLYEITGDETHAQRALFSAGERIRIAREQLKDGRDHGCAGNTIGAIASGHGRADRFGDVNTVLGPLCLGSMRLFSAEQPLVVYPDGIPESVISLVRWSPEPSITWTNTGEDAVTVRWRDASNPDGAATVARIPAGQTETAILSGSIPGSGVCAVDCEEE
jgi:hypothetical protein